MKTLIAVQPSLSHFYHSCQPEDVYNGMCFEAPRGSKTFGFLPWL